MLALTPIAEPLVLEPPIENLAAAAAFPVTPKCFILCGVRAPDETERGVT